MLQFSLHDVINVEIIKKMLKKFNQIIQLPIAIVDINNTIIVSEGFANICKRDCTDFLRLHKLYLNLHLENNHTNLSPPFEVIPCPDGSNLYRIPVYIKDTILANILFLNLVETEGKIRSTNCDDTIARRAIEFIDIIIEMINNMYEKYCDNQGIQIQLIKENKELVVSRDKLLSLHEELTKKFNHLQYNERVLHNKQLIDTVITIGSMIEKRDLYTARHQKKVAYLTCKIATAMGIKHETFKGLYIAAMLHDIGKIGIPAEILSKPDKLTPAEFEIIKSHVQIAYDILRKIDFPWPVAEIVLQHHEKLNGTGYPNGITKDKILLEAKIISVADVVEAITAHRPYRPALGLSFALEEIKSYSGIYYDKEVVEACVKVCTENNWDKMADLALSEHYLNNLKMF